MHSYRKIAELLTNDAATRDAVDEIRTMLLNP
jgi:hypothetical protein